MDTQLKIERLVELALLQRTELKELVEQLPQMRQFLTDEIEKNLEVIEPQLRSELEEFAKNKSGELADSIEINLTEKVDELLRNLERTTAAKYSVLLAEKNKTKEIEQQAKELIAAATLEIPSAVKLIVLDELSRFPRAGEIDQLRKEFAEPKGLNPRGKWQASERYQRLDLVAYNGDSYVSNTDDNKEKPSRNTSAWTLSAARGTGGGGGGVTSILDLVGPSTNGQLLIGSNGDFAKATLTAGSGVTIANAPGSITISAPDSGTVTSVSVTTANGVSGTVATSTTTPAISLTLGAITPTTVNAVTLSGSSTPTLAVTGTSAISGTNTGDQTITLTGDVTGTGTGSFVTAIAEGVIVNADINASAAIVDTKLATISTASKVSNSATTAASANTASAIVARDASGNFTAGTITAAFNGTLGATTPSTVAATTASLSGALTYGGVTLSNAVTGTGNMVLSASPTLTGTLTAAIANFSGLLTASGKVTITNASAADAGLRLQSTGATGFFDFEAADTQLVIQGNNNAAITVLSTGNTTFGPSASALSTFLGSAALSGNVASTSTTTGTLVVTGGVGVSQRSWFGGAYSTTNAVALNISSDIPAVSFQDTSGTGSDRNFTLTNSYTNAGKFELLYGTSAGAAPSVVALTVDANASGLLTLIGSLTMSGTLTGAATLTGTNVIKSAVLTALTLGTQSFGTSVSFASATGIPTFNTATNINGVATVGAGGALTQTDSLIVKGNATSATYTHLGGFGSDTYFFNNYWYNGSNQTDDQTKASSGIMLLVSGGFNFQTAPAAAAPSRITLASLTGTTLATGVFQVFSTTSGTSTTAAAVLAKSLGLTENLYVGGVINGASTITTLGGATFHTTSSALTNGAGVSVGTLTTAPSAGNPTKWIGINDNGTTRYIPAW